MSWFSSIVGDISGEVSHIASSIGGEVSHITSSIGGEVSHIATSVAGEVGTVYAHVIRPALPIIATGISAVVAPYTTPYLMSADIGIYGHGALTGGIQGVINPTLGSYEAGAVTAALYGAGQLYNGISGATGTVSEAGTGTSANLSAIPNMPSFSSYSLSNAIPSETQQLLSNPNILSIPNITPLGSSSLSELANIEGSNVYSNFEQGLYNPTSNTSVLDTLGNAASSVYNTFGGIGKGLLSVTGLAEGGLSAYNALRSTVGQPTVNILGQLQPTPTGGQQTPTGLPGAAQEAQNQQGGSSGNVLNVAGGGIGVTSTSNTTEAIEIAAIAAIGGAILAS